MIPAGHRRLILTRHAKSSWDDPLLDDHQRPLNARGRRAARELGDVLASRGHDPEEVLCSTATRTQETWELISDAVFETRPRVCFLQSLYCATPEVMLDELRTAQRQVVLMIGHNPGIAELAARLPAEPPMHPDFRRYPTAATLVVDFQIESWADLKPGDGSVMDFIGVDGRR